MCKYTPAYYNDFACIADKCPDSCCRNWEIVIDSETEEKYKKVQGSFGEKLVSSLTKDEDGDCCFRLKDGNCPFLRKDGLCDIHIKLGQSYTSEVCRQHPRFIEEYDGFTEISLSLSCPEASRIILEQKKDHEIYPVPEYSGNDEVLALLIESRRYLLSLNGSVPDILDTIIYVAADDQSSIDGEQINVPEKDIIKLPDFIDFLNKSLEILTTEWKEMINCILEKSVNRSEFIKYISENEKSIKNIIDYFLYRDYLKAVNDCDILSHGFYIVMSVLTVAYISCAGRYPLKRCAELYSKEIEHDTDNIDKILDHISDVIY